eukprot:m.341815 g.341815  ORF g.341815 m.341815 type:complete len:508 (+) comp20544_c0_seq1:74-1597(+)
MPLDTMETGDTGTMNLFGTLREHAPAVEGVEHTKRYRTASYKPQEQTPDTLQGVTLPGVSSLARSMSGKRSGPPGQIGLKELSKWYEEQNLGSAKYTESEWKQSLKFVKDSGLTRKNMSSQARASAVKNRRRISSHLGKKGQEVQSNFVHRIEDIQQARKDLKRCHESCCDELKALQRRLEEAEEFRNSRFTWPMRVNEACLEFREKRIGIDRVMDQVEIELLKEKETVQSIADATVDKVITRTKDLVSRLQTQCESLQEDLDRKATSMKIDQNTKALPPSRALPVHYDNVQARPATAVELSHWRTNSKQLIAETNSMMENSVKLRKRLTRVCNKAEDEMLACCEQASNAVAKGLRRAQYARDAVCKLLEDVKYEIATNEKERTSLEELIAAQEIPLRLTTTQLKERTERPTGEETNDEVHQSLVEKVAELDAAVEALTNELNTNLYNQEELKNMEATLEEDFAIKKNTLLQETRCTKVRSFLNPETDTYVIKKMMTDEAFFDLMTR